MAEPPVSSPISERLFNSPLECGFRVLFLLHAIKPATSDLQRLLSYDYLLVHSGDVDIDVLSLHPAVPFRGSEWLVKRDLVRSALDLMFSKELIEKKLGRDGITYTASSLTTAFIDLLKTEYATELLSRAAWVAKEFGEMSDDELTKYMTANVGKWGAEFERLTALRDLNLEGE